MNFLGLPLNNIKFVNPLFCLVTISKSKRFLLPESEEYFDCTTRSVNVGVYLNVYDSIW